MHGLSLANVHMMCFAASYAVAMVLELSRLVHRARIRHVGTVVFTAAGLLAHSIYILMRASRPPGQAPLLSSWYDWLLLVAWGIAATYLVLAIRRPQASAGIFMLPMVLLLIAVASGFRDAVPFDRDQVWLWAIVHGAALLLGSVFVMLGFVAGVMYLVQSNRLKRKRPPRQGLKLPSLEWLQRANKLALVVGSFLLAGGLLSGVMLNMARPQRGMPWSDPVVWTSGVLLAWLMVVLVFEAIYKPAQQGRKVAYLTVASFAFLVLVLAIVLFGPSQHASPPAPAPSVAHAARKAIDSKPGGDKR